MFMRALQVDGGAPLEFQLGVSPIARANLGLAALLLLAVGVIAGIELGRRAETRG